MLGRCRYDYRCRTRALYPGAASLALIPSVNVISARSTMMSLRVSPRVSVMGDRG